MIERQLKGRDITDKTVLKAMEDVPRQRFVSPAQQDMAYADRPLPIGHGQTISQPYVVAFMTQMLEVRPEDKILEIGTGCGYQAAVLARLAKQVYTIEIVEPLADDARKLLAELGYTNIFIKAGDGFDGWSEHAPFDKIILTCAVKEFPPKLIEQLKEGGRIIAPLGPPGYAQELVLATKTNGQLTEQKRAAGAVCADDGQGDGGVGCNSRPKKLCSFLCSLQRNEPKKRRPAAWSRLLRDSPRENHKHGVVTNSCPTARASNM